MIDAYVAIRHPVAVETQCWRMLLGESSRLQYGTRTRDWDYRFRRRKTASAVGFRSQACGPVAEPSCVRLRCADAPRSPCRRLRRHLRPRRTARLAVDLEPNPDLLYGGEGISRAALV